jgi:nitroimidazol reductase NimA-like FMN-containing flavoprotein (pyridoxamine 5'-phosphate oxidase superfamily)
MTVKKMTNEEIDNFLACSRVGRLRVALEDGAYVVPVGFGFSDGKIFFHTCSKGLKVDAIRKNPNVCFELDEALSDTSIYKSVIILGTAEIIDDRDRMIPFLQKLIDKYRAPTNLDEYLIRLGLNKENELKTVRICTIRPKSITGRTYVR